jgi:phosphoribosylformylglycinamidine synthase
VYLLGTTKLELDGSAWAGTVHGHLGGRPPAVDLGREKALAELLAAAADEQLLTSAHDLADGGLGQSLAESVLRFGIGARVVLDELGERDGVDAATALFSESTGRVIVTVRREDDVRFQGLCDGRGYPVLRIGVTDAASNALEVQGRFTVSVDELGATHRGTLPARFGAVIDEPAIAEPAV